jgi:tRNA A-37 threonylcarbamoyl transferase component Bud32
MHKLARATFGVILSERSTMEDYFFVNPVQSSEASQAFSSPTALNQQYALQEELRRRGLKNLKFIKGLKGGFTSQVYEAELEGIRVVVKHTEDLIPANQTELFISRQGHNTDIHILKLLQDTRIRVPEILHHFPDITTTVMEDLRTSDFTLLAGLMQQGRAPYSGYSIGRMLAELNIQARQWTGFKVNLSAHQNAYEKGLELMVMHPNSNKYFKEMEEVFVSNNNYIAWVDAHPKNIFIDKRGGVAFIDFGNSSFSDQRFVLPNFLAHIIVYSLAGFYAVEDAVLFMQECVQGYKDLETVDEYIFCRYFGMEVLHRASGKWLDGINSPDQKLRSFGLGLNIFDKQVSNIDSLIELIIRS